jgi:hypothetical protein
MFKTEYAVEAKASPKQIWKLFEDVPGWKSWNAGIAAIELNGPFAEGTEFAMTPTGGPPMVSRLVEVKKEVGFTDVTVVDEITVRVAHLIEPKGSGSRVTFAVEVEGPGAEEVGKMVSGDFPEVLAALAKKAESGAHMSMSSPP